ncbi:MAG: DUF2461 domain-containing protein [Prevotellaceae bacterium]|jgi:uncharacterized protein (TIGR02453 family)|nr:DUF2461 domain-containing protein [Prevotellaceae bacterium]
MLRTSISFLRELIANNYKDWFDANRNYYQEAKNEFDRFIDRLIVEIRLFDPTIGSITAKDCVYRIYRDVRFSNDKTPYKNHFGAYIAQGGRKSLLGGYYFHIEPADAGYLDHSMWAGGIYSPDAPMLKAIRTDIYEHPEEYKAIIRNKEFAGTFKWFNGNMLSAAPKGFPKDFADMDLIKRKDYTFYRYIDEKTLLSNCLLEESIRVYKLTLPFNRFMNRAIQYHLEADF